MTGPRLTEQDLERFYQEYQATKQPDPMKPTTPRVASDATRVVSSKPTGKTYWNDPVQLARSAAQGATLGFGDEAEAGVRFLLPKAIGGGDYAPLLADIRGQNKQYASEHPVANLLAQLGGGMMTGGALTKAIGAVPAAMEGASVMAKIGSAAKTGAKVGGITGAVAGLGSGETTGQRLGGAALGAAGGGLFGAAAGAIGQTVASADEIKPWVLDILGKTTGDAAKQRALGKLATDLQNAGHSPETIRAAFADIPEDVPVNIMDVGGQNVRDRGMAVAAVPGRGKETVTSALVARRKGEGARTIEAFKNATGGTPDEVNMTTAAMERARGVAADQEYGAAREAGSALLSPKYRELLESPTIAKMYGDVTDQLAETGKQLQPLYETVHTMTKDGPAEALRVMDTPNVETLDYIYRALRDKAKASFKADRSLAGRQYKTLANQIKGLLDDPAIGVPEYTAARQNFAKASDLIDARSAGKDFRKLQPEELTSTIGDLSDDAAKQYRSGATRQAYEEVRTRGNRTAMSKVDANEQMRDQNMALSHPDQRGDFAARLDAEHTMNDTYNKVLSGSRTTPLKENVENLGSSEWEKVNSAIDALATPTTKAGIVKRVKDAIQNRALAGRGDVANELGDMVVKGTASRQDLSDLIDEIAGFQRSKSLVAPRGPALGRTRAAALIGYGSGRVSGTP